MEIINFIISNISDAFTIMSEFYVLPGLSLLTFCIILLILNTLFDIFWFGAKSFMSSDIHYEANRTRNSRYNKE